jgi:SAM-dependent methyltransferase
MVTLKALVRPFVPASIARRLKFISLQKRSNADIFGEIYRTKTWGGPDKDFYSGPGNEPDVIAPYISGVRRFLAKHPGSVVVDIGCGDFVAGSQLLDLAKTYIGCDVVADLIERNRRKFPNVNFEALDAAKDPLPSGDIVIVKQVLQHLRNDQIQAIVNKLRQYKIWIICDHIPIGSFTANIDVQTGPGVRIRFNSGVVLTEAPFSVKPRTTEVLSEVASYHGIIRTLAYSF